MSKPIFPVNAHESFRMVHPQAMKKAEVRRLKTEGAANSIQAEQSLDGPAASQYAYLNFIPNSVF
jgi:hypothetical protein